MLAEEIAAAIGVRLFRLTYVFRYRSLWVARPVYVHVGLGLFAEPFADAGSFTIEYLFKSVQNVVEMIGNVKVIDFPLLPSSSFIRRYSYSYMGIPILLRAIIALFST